MSLQNRITRESTFVNNLFEGNEFLNSGHLLETFHSEIISLARNLIKASCIRFWIIGSKPVDQGLITINIDADTEDVYQEKYCTLDPMHPSRFENKKISVVCSDTLMSQSEWRNSDFYTQFMAPRDYDHDVDMFFRSDNKIVAVLSIIRDDKLGPFTKEELALLDNIQPFLEFSFNAVYRPQPTTMRDYFSDQYQLTERELDVAEIAMVGVSTKIIARELDLSVATIKTHLQHIFEKVNVHSTKELISLMFSEVKQ